MAKRKPPRSQRRGRSRPLPPPPPAPIAQRPVEPAAGPAVVTAPAPAPATAPRERSISRFTVRDYTYVRRELVRIAILAIGIFVLIVVLSFFLP